MKVERNTSKVNVDQISQKADKVTHNLPPVMKNFDKEKSWATILTKMGAVDKKVLTWTLAMAASLSMVIAASISDWDFVDHIFETETQELQSSEERPQPLEFDQLTSKKQYTELQTPTIHHAELSNVTLTEPSQDIVPNIEYHETPIPTINDHEAKSFIRPYASIAYQQGFAPEFGFDATVWTSKNNSKRIGIGLSSQFAMVANESGTSSIQPFAFLNVSYENNKTEKKGWVTQASVLLNPDGNFYEDHALRLSLQKNITKHLKLGPQLIFVDSFRTIYPGISLTLI